MSAGWVAGSVRARALARRRIGGDLARQVAGAGSLGGALAILAGTAYRPAVPRDRAAAPGAGAPGAAAVTDLARAQHAVAAGLLWNLRVLAGWLPRGGAQLMRALAGWFEIANVAEKLRELSGQEPGEMFRLGALATAWQQAQQAESQAGLRAALMASAWGDPGDGGALEIEVGLRARWAQRVAAIGGPARTWAASALAVLAAGEWYGAGRAGHPVLRSAAADLLGPRAAAARSAADFAEALPGGLRWVLTGVRDVPADLWRAEAGWWARLERDGHALLGGSGLDVRPVLGSVAVLAADARRVRSALESAARGSGAIGAYDAVA